MPPTSVSRLCRTDFSFDILDVFPENWRARRGFSLYDHTPRPFAALFFVCGDLKATFLPSDGKEGVTVGKGGVVYIPKGACYRVRVAGQTTEAVQTYTVNLRLYDEARREIALADKIAVIAELRDNRAAARLAPLNDAFREGGGAPGGCNAARVKGEVYLLFDLISTFEEKTDDAYYPIRRGADALSAEWNKNEKMEKYAALAGVSVTYFYRCFRKWTGKSPVAYRNALRLSHAETLLRCTDMRVREIAQAVGFDDPFYFCRLFGKVYGLAPKNYRDSRRGGEG